MGAPLELRGMPLIDGHVHSFGPQAGLPGFNPLVTVTLGGSDLAFLESPDHAVGSDELSRLGRDLRSTLAYHHAVHALAEFLGCDPAPEAVLAARDNRCRDFVQYVASLYADIGLQMSIVDIGLGSIDLDGFAHLAGVPVKGVFRIEPLIASLWDEHEDLSSFDRAFINALNAEVSTGRHVALKSIIAYRTGLAVERPDDTAVAAAFNTLKESSESDGLMRRVRVPHDAVQYAKALRDHWLWRALELSIDVDLPFQIHCGMGDQDLDISTARPGLLAAVFRDPRLRHARIVLLHGAYPFHEEAAYLVDVFPNVYLDLSEHNLFLGPNVAAVLRPVLALAPFTKLLFGSDAYGSPDLQWIAARATIAALEHVLGELVDAGSLGRKAGLDAAARILAGNAIELYKLGG
jgi:predicted TIM-barrel fold metal-dependent hydrolase